MKIYIASRFAMKDEVRKIYDRIEGMGHEVSSDWTKHEPIKPYSENRDLAKAYAIQDVNGAKDCDVFILITNQAGTGMYVELGIAMLSSMIRGRPKIFVVGDHVDRNMFFFHPSITVKETVDQVLNEISGI